MREIEIKAKLKNKAQTMKKLSSIGCVFGEATVQDDVVYTKNVGSIKAHRSNKAFLRIRVKNNSKILFTYKVRGINDLDSIEHELAIDSKNEMEKILLHMGYKKAMDIKKTRIITHYNDCEICIDEVKGLGSFIEMEKLTTDTSDGKKIQDELFTFFESIGIKKTDRVSSGYDILTLEKAERK